jgi:hypothetical protein
MTKRPPQSERGTSAEGSAENPLTKAGAVKAMERFKTLARNLLRVPAENIKEEERKFQQKRPSARKRRKVG